MPATATILDEILASVKPITVRALRGRELHCKGWVQEAALRMLLNNLDLEVAERPLDLVVYGGIGKAARNWPAFKTIVKSLLELRDDETLLVQSGKAVGILPSHKNAPRVLIANSNLVPKWATWEVFRELDKKGLIMFGQMTAGSWIYIGSQGILQGTYETFAEVGRKLNSENRKPKTENAPLSGRLVVTAGLGGMGGAQPLSVTMAGGVALCIEIDPSRIQKRLETQYIDQVAETLDEALEACQKAKAEGRALSVALCANAADVVPELVRRNITPDALTDQTSAHDVLNGYVPNNYSLKDAEILRKENPDKYLQEANRAVCEHVRAMLELQKRGAETFDYGNNIRQVAFDNGVKNAFDFPGFVPAYIRPLFCEGKGPFRWAALSGDAADIRAIDAAILREFADNDPLCRWIRMAGERVAFQGLPARICWLGLGDRARLGGVINDMVASGEVSAPVVIGRDHLDCGSVASPNRETEAMKDGSDAVSDWVFLNALINAVNGASWVSVHHGGGVGMGYSQHAGMVIVADGTPEAGERLARVLNSDPAMGVLRHADAGYEKAWETAREKGVRIPSAGG